MPFVDFFSCHRPTSTTSSSPDPAVTVASYRRAGDHTVAGAANWVLPAQGFRGRRSVRQTPTSRIRMRKWIDPNPSRPRHPLSLTDTPRLWKNESRSDRADRRPLPVLSEPRGRIGLPGEPCSEERDPPLGPPSTNAREKRLSRPHPGCLPPPSPFDRDHVAAVPGWLVAEASNRGKVALPARSSLR